ncbi:MAG: exosortase/archaeosortase family protein [Candidatus Omnitrophota bacterium]
MTIKNILKTNVLKIIILVFLLAGIFVPTFVSLSGRFTAADSYYSHGFLIPFVCAYLVWRKRSKLKSLPIEPCQTGLIVLAGGLLLLIISSLLKINFGSYFSLIIVIEGLVLYLWGRKINRELIFPIVFLIFMIPLPSVVIIAISFKMKILAAQAASFFANRIGILAVRDGSIIYLPNGKQLMVGDPCSGLRSLISLLALGAIFTQFVRGSRLQKNALFISAIPIALVSNILRLMALVWVTYVYGEKAALGFFHDFTGMLVFVFAFLGLMFMTRVLKFKFIHE